MIKTKAASLVKYIVAKSLKRRLVFLPLSENGSGAGAWQIKDLLLMRYTYRASSEGFVTYQLQEDGRDLQFSLYTMALLGSQPISGELCFSFQLPSVTRGDNLRINLNEPGAWMNDRSIDLAPDHFKQTRKYIAKLQLHTAQGLRTRSVMHYLPYENKPIGEDYYFGDDYTEYPLHTVTAYAVNLVHQHCTGGRLLDIGCALGIYTKAFMDAGFDVRGMDISEFGIAEASKRVGPDRVRQCNLDLSDIPFETTFDAFWMWDVLEHVSDPEGALTKVTKKAAPGAWLFLHTSNSDSLSHRLLGSDWEGYSDYSHYGVDKVSATSLAAWLNNMGWEIVDWQCGQVWVFGVDPVFIGLRNAFDTIPELATFLSERELGDNLIVVARRREDGPRSS
ncbi:MAG: class I SAM-dependent methyltransferase [Pyrinomonadaceae bacterium]|nr:class I SAM-dependent methyltransferase [Pyrinomonadaceae bacterium]